MIDPEPDALAVTIAEAALPPRLEAAVLLRDLGPWFSTRFDREGKSAALAELSALMQLEPVERAEVVAAVLDGRMTYLDLGAVDLVPTAPAHRYSWKRLREGWAKPWSPDDIKPLSDEELDAALNAK